MSGLILKGAETALQDAILDALRADADMTALFGDPPRILDMAGAKPAFPYLEVARHEASPASGDDAPMMAHVIDLHIFTRWGGRDAARDAVAQVRRVLEGASLTLTDHRLVYCYPVFSDALMLRDLSTVRGVVRLRALTETVTPGA